MAGFNERARYTRDQIREIMERANTEGKHISGSSVLSISHLLANADGTFSIMSHINCEHCDYCAEGKPEVEIDGVSYPGFFSGPHDAREDPYQEANR
jgi:hypothetical protein